MSRLAITSIVAAAAIAVLGPSSAALAAGGTASGADLQASGSASTGSPVAGQPFTYNFQVKNAGPSDASSSSFSDQLPAGTVLTSAQATSNGVATQCSAADGSGAKVVSCDLGTILKGGQATVQINVNAPSTAGTYSDTGTASSPLADPQPSNNSATVTVKVQPLPTCTLPAGQTTMHGMVMEKYTNSSGLFEDFLFQVNGVNYYVKTNFYDGTLPLTSIVNLLCKPVSTVFVQGGEFIDVTGTDSGTTITLPGTTTPIEVLNASVIQVPFYFDKAL
jgi:uncharacterized repeat protein (TIGR01451 family)